MTDTNTPVKKVRKVSHLGRSSTVPLAYAYIIDQKIGEKMRIRRSMLGLTQDELAKEMGITFQQVQKYEVGRNKLSSSRLWDLSRILKVPMSYFFEDVIDALMDEDSFAEKKDSLFVQEDGESLGLATSIFQKKDMIEMIRNFSKIENEDIRKNILELIKSLASS